jgi:prolipoprotein diacylglyceryltransferase
MQLLILIPSLLVFLYSLYRLVKDDYVFIRKGISLEQSYDIAFVTLWVSLIFSRLFYLLFHLQSGKNIFLQFFSFTQGGFSLIGAILGGILALLFIGRYKRVPLGRLSDFMSLSFMFALPLGFLANAIFVTKGELLFTFLSAVLYFLLMMFFVQFLKPKLMSRTMKEGTLSILFLLFFSVISLVVSLLSSLKNIPEMLTGQNFATLGLLIFSIILLIKEERPFSRHRRSLNR